MAVSVIKNDNFPTAVAPTIENPIFTQLQGGYQRKGRQVLVNIGLYVNGTFGPNDYSTAVDQLPKPNAPTALSVVTNSNGSKGAAAILRTDGAIRIDTGVKELSYETIYISGIYTIA